MTRETVETEPRPVALVTGGSQGLGKAVVEALAARGWYVVTNARHPAGLHAASSGWTGAGTIEAIAGDVTDTNHQDQLVAAVHRAGRLDLLMHNASTLGLTPLPALADVRRTELAPVWRTNVEAPLNLTTALLPWLRASSGVLLSVSSDAAVEHDPGWGLYGATKAALDHLTLTFGQEEPRIRAYAVDPGDMRTQMHQDAFPGEDISDRPVPETVVPHLLALLDRRPPSGRVRAAAIAVAEGVA